MATLEMGGRQVNNKGIEETKDPMDSVYGFRIENEDDEEKLGMLGSIKRYFNVSLYVPQVYIFDQIEDDIREYKLNPIQRFFMTFEDPNASLIGRVANIITIATILLSCASFIAASSPEFQTGECKVVVCDNEDLCPNEKICKPEPDESFSYIEFTCIVIFSVEYGARMISCWSVPARLAGLVPTGWDDAWVEITLDSESAEDISEEQRRIRKSKLRAQVKKEPVYSWWYQIMKYSWQPFNLVDLGAILPWYLILVAGDQLGSSGGILRILRILRVFRVLKLGRRNKSVELLTNTLQASTNVLMLLIFFFVLAVVVFGALLFFLEQGEFEVTEEFPNGAYLRPSGMPGEPQQESPFTSMITAFYFAVITLATTGYGELAPTSPMGRFFSNVCMLTGVLMVALPISVVGSNFTNEYNAVHGEDMDNEQIYSCLLELIDDDQYDPTTQEKIPAQVTRSRHVAAISAIVSCLDAIKHRKLKKELLNYIEQSRPENPTLKGKTKKRKSNRPRTPPRRNSKGDDDGATAEVDEARIERERDLKDLSFILERLELLLDGQSHQYGGGDSVSAETRVPAFTVDRADGHEATKSKSKGAKGKGKGGMAASSSSSSSSSSLQYSSAAQPRPSQLHYLYEESKDIAVLNEDREWLDMVARESGVQHAIQREPLETVQDLVVRMQTLYMSYGGKGVGKGGSKGAWFKSAIDKAEVQALALETAELHLVDLSVLSPEDQHTFFMCTYTLLCIHASAACKTNIETIVQTYPARVGYKIGKRIYTLAEIYDLGVPTNQQQSEHEVPTMN